MVARSPFNNFINARSINRIYRRFCARPIHIHIILVANFTIYVFVTNKRAFRYKSPEERIFLTLT